LFLQYSFSAAVAFYIKIMQKKNCLFLAKYSSKKAGSLPPNGIIINNILSVTICFTALAAICLALTFNP
jgi:hypothetical protein